jgi:hypothetical protein
MLQKQIVFLRRGEKPTHAGRKPRVEVPFLLCGRQRAVGREPGLVREEQSRSGPMGTAS